MPYLYQMQINGMPHMGKLLINVMKQRLITKTELAAKMNLAFSTVNQYCKQNTLHAALL